MARNDISNPLGVTNALRSGDRAGIAGHGNAPLVMTHGVSVQFLRSRLQSKSEKYTDRVLDDMTKNDMLYALRLFEDPKNVK